MTTPMLIFRRSHHHPGPFYCRRPSHRHTAGPDTFRAMFRALDNHDIQFNVLLDISVHATTDDHHL